MCYFYNTICGIQWMKFCGSTCYFSVKMRNDNADASAPLRSGKIRFIYDFLFQFPLLYVRTETYMAAEFLRTTSLLDRHSLSCDVHVLICTRATLIWEAIILISRAYATEPPACFANASVFVFPVPGTSWLPTNICLLTYRYASSEPLYTLYFAVTIIALFLLPCRKLSQIVRHFSLHAIINSLLDATSKYISEITRAVKKLPVQFRHLRALSNA